MTARALTSAHKDMLVEWFGQGLSPQGVQARIEHHNQQLLEAAQQAARNKLPAPTEQPFPPLSLKALQRQWKALQARVDEFVVEEITREKMLRRGGLRDRDERIRRLQVAAEKLEPWLGVVNRRGEFTANITYGEHLRQIAEEMGEMGTAKKLGDGAARSLPDDMLKEIYTQLKERASAV